LLLDETGATRYSLKYLVQSVPNLDLAPQELKTSVITIKVPSNAEPGGHYGVIRFTAVPPNLQGTGVALSASVGTLVLLRVNGPVTDNLSVAEFASGHQSQNGTWKGNNFFETGPVDFLARLHNGGTVHEKPEGKITVKNLLGKPVGSVVVNSKGGNVLPDSIRRFTQTLNSKKLFGYYTATMAVTYAGNQSLGAKLSFWVIPWKLLLIVMAVLVVMFFLIKIGLRKYNDHIISQARRRR